MTRFNRLLTIHRLQGDNNTTQWWWPYSSAIVGENNADFSPHFILLLIQKLFKMKICPTLLWKNSDFGDNLNRIGWRRIEWISVQFAQVSGFDWTWYVWYSIFSLGEREWSRNEFGFGFSGEMKMRMEIYIFVDFYLVEKEGCADRM